LTLARVLYVAGDFLIVALIVAGNTDQHEAAFGFLGSRGGCLALSIESTASSVAFDVHLEDNRMVHQAVDSSDHHSVVAEHLGMPQRLTGESLRYG
jgi:hypothetical protein